METYEELEVKYKKAFDKWDINSKTFVGFIRNMFGEPFVIFKRSKKYAVTGSELDWEATYFENNKHWFSRDDERPKIISAIEEYEASKLKKQIK